MHYAVIAAGKGSRLAGAGVKPLVKPAGETLAERILRIVCARPDAESVTIVTNSSTPEVGGHVRSLGLTPQPLVIEADTPGAMCSLALAVKEPRCVALTVDTVFSPGRFSDFVDAFATGGSDSLMGVSDFIDDEKPLFVKTDTAGRICDFSDTPGAPLVSAGIYGLGPKALSVLRQCRQNGLTCLREFQRQLLTRGVDVAAFNMGKVIDVDRPHDVDTAREFINSETDAPWPQ